MSSGWESLVRPSITTSSVRPSLRHADSLSFALYYAPDLHSHLVEHLSASTPLIPLENHIRVGPLLPRTSQSVRMRFMALEEGVHEVETLQIMGVGDGFAINLK